MREGAFFLVWFVLLYSFESTGTWGFPMGQSKVPSTCEQLFWTDYGSTDAFDEVGKIDFKNLEEVATAAQQLIESIQKNCVKGAAFTAKLCGRMVMSVPGLAWQVTTFDPTFKNLKKTIILPLAGHVRKLRSGGASENDRISLLVFVPRAILVLGKSIPQISVSTLVGSIPIGRRESADSLDSAFGEYLWKMVGVLMSVAKEGIDSQTFDRLRMATEKINQEMGPEIAAAIGLDELLEAFGPL